MRGWPGAGESVSQRVAGVVAAAPAAKRAQRAQRAHALGEARNSVRDDENIDAGAAAIVGTVLRARVAFRLPEQISPAAASGARVHASSHRICKSAVGAVDVQVSRLAVCRPMGGRVPVGTAESLDHANAVLPYRCVPARSEHLRA